jgi:hypothetical protein
MTSPSPALTVRRRSRTKSEEAVRARLRRSKVCILRGFVQFPEAKKRAIRNAAERAGLSWGGTFSDPIHFYFDPIPGQDRTALINNFAEQVRLLKAKR